MSLVGNLEDLSLGDIMQIISLSQKSGVLALKCEEGAGRIVFRSGLVYAANLEGRGDDLRDLLVESQTVDASTYDAFVAHADKVGESVVDLLIAKRNLTTEQLDGLLRDSVESSILEMFGWCSGDFSFDVRTQLDRADPQLILSTGVNAQYLAMEGMRICDERTRDASLSSAEPETQEPVQESAGGSDGLFGEEFVDVDASRPPTPSDSVESLSAADIAVATILSNDAAAHDSEFERTSEAPNIECLETELVEANFESEGVVIDEFEFSNDAVSEPSPRVAARQPVAETTKRPLVLIESDVAVLEWAKNAVESDFSRIHAFQHAEQGLSRIRQYLIRGEYPVVLISTATRIDPLSGIHGLSDFVSRLKSQAAKLLVIGLWEGGEDSSATTPSPTAQSVAAQGAFDAMVLRPDGRRFRAQNGPPDTAFAETFAAAVRAGCGITIEPIASTPLHED